MNATTVTIRTPPEYKMFLASPTEIQCCPACGLEFAVIMPHRVNGHVDWSRIIANACPQCFARLFTTGENDGG